MATHCKSHLPPIVSDVLSRHAYDEAQPDYPQECDYVHQRVKVGQVQVFVASLIEQVLLGVVQCCKEQEDKETDCEAAPPDNLSVS